MRRRKTQKTPPCGLRRARACGTGAAGSAGQPQRRSSVQRADRIPKRGHPRLRRTPRPLARREIGDFYRRVYHSPGKAPGSTSDMSFSLVDSRPRPSPPAHPEPAPASTTSITSTTSTTSTRSHRPRLIAPGHHRRPILSQPPPAPPAPAATAPGSSPPVPAAFPVGSSSPAWGGARFPEGPAETFPGGGGLQGCHAQRESDAPGRPSLPPHRRQAASFSGAIFVQFPRRFSTVARVA